MWPLVYRNVVYGAVFWGVLVFWVILELLGPIKWRAGNDVDYDKGSLLIALFSGVGGLVFCFLLPVFLSGANMLHAHLCFFVGMLLMCGGIAWRWYAVRTLGTYFTLAVSIQNDHRVIQHGPYRFIRHPSYSGALVALCGVGLILTNWASLFVLVACSFAGIIYRIAVEERALVDALGYPYVEYRSRTKKLIPFVF